MTYEGSVDIMQELQNGATGYDAVFPANSIWISMGDTGLKSEASTIYKLQHR